MTNDKEKTTWKFSLIINEKKKIFSLKSSLNQKLSVTNNKKGCFKPHHKLTPRVLIPFSYQFSSNM